MVNIFERGQALEINDGTIQVLIPKRALRVDPEPIDKVTIRDIEANRMFSYNASDVRDKDGNLVGGLQDVLDYLTPFVGFNFANAGGGGGTIDLGEFQNEVNASVFVDGTVVGEIAYARESTGSKWLAATSLGDYYPEGWYEWNGNAWVSNRNAIANELNNLVLSNQAVVPEVTLNTSHRANMNNPHNVDPTQQQSINYTLLFNNALI